MSAFSAGTVKEEQDMLVIRNIDLTVRQVGGPLRFEPRRFESILNHVCHERMSRASTSTDQQNEQVSLYTHAPEIYLLLFITLDQIKGFFLSLSHVVFMLSNHR